MSNFLEQQLIYRDDDILIINKPAGILTIPGKGDLTDSVLTRLQQIEPKTLLIHRLDRDTSGILIFALTKSAQSHISKQFQARETEKTYIAIVTGTLTGQGMIDIPVVYDPSCPPLHKVDPQEKKAAITHWNAIEQFTLSNREVTRVKLIPITGRSHQLRVHMQYLGHAIVGDTLYAQPEDQILTPALCLHSETLSFIHPTTAERLTFHCPALF